MFEYQLMDFWKNKNLDVLYTVPAMIIGLYSMMTQECQFGEIFVDIISTCTANKTCNLKALVHGDTSKTFAMTTVMTSIAEVYELEQSE